MKMIMLQINKRRNSEQLNSLMSQTVKTTRDPIKPILGNNLLIISIYNVILFLYKNILFI